MSKLCTAVKKIHCISFLKLFPTKHCQKSVLYCMQSGSVLYSRVCQTSMMKLFVKIFTINYFHKTLQSTRGALTHFCRYKKMLFFKLSVSEICGVIWCIRMYCIRVFCPTMRNEVDIVCVKLNIFLQILHAINNI